MQLHNLKLSFHSSKTAHLLGVLDIDSPELNRFTEDDRIGLERVVQVLVKHI